MSQKIRVIHVNPTRPGTRESNVFGWQSALRTMRDARADGYTSQASVRVSHKVENGRAVERRKYGRAWAPKRRETSAEKVARARALADAGEHAEAAALLLALAMEDRNGDIGYAERMRWHETSGALERAGFDLRAFFVAKGAEPIK